MTSPYNYNQYRSAYDNQAHDRNSQMYWDAVSMTSSDRNSIALSIYHSVPELHQEEAAASMHSQSNRNDKNWHEHKSVDFVLAYNPNERQKIKRQIFEKNLLSEGLLLHHDEAQNIHFVKIHVTHEVLCRYAEILKFKFPIKLDENESDFALEDEIGEVSRSIKSIFDSIYKYIRLDKRLFPSRKYELYHEFSRDKSYLFDVNDPDFFPCYVRLAVVSFILERTAFADNPGDNLNCVGIDKLLADKVYMTAYPLHDGHHMDRGTQRALLFNEWAKMKNWLKHQPLDAIKNYFGVKIALYFSWLGFYTNMLIIPSILGLLCFIYGLFTMFSNPVVDKICNANDSVVLCPKCDGCDYTLLSDTCTYSRINHILDNNVSVFFAVCMAIWAAIYLELWKRYSAKIVHRWGMSDYCRQSEHPRPAYLARIKHKKKVKNRINPVTRQTEPTLSFSKKLPSYLLSYSIILLYICISIAVVVALIIYRMATMGSKKVTAIVDHIDPVSYRYLIILPVTTGIINLIAITILNYLYDYLAVILTNLEYRRTQTEYDNSLSLKIYLFQFINYYSSLFYIAFIKGKWPGTPAKYNRVFGLRQEECSPGGCLMELFIQLAIIMIGKQALNALIEMALPLMMKKYNKFMFGYRQKDEEEAELKACNQWTKDFKLMEWDSMGLFHEYLEMILQFGFCTLFVIAFPLGPFFALVNNIFELRLDARKFLMYFRRPVPRRVSDIGIWLGVMNVLGRLSVITTAFIIAFSSGFIPRLVHHFSEDLNKLDYLEFTLAYFDTSHFEEKKGDEKYSVCRYPEFRNPPDHPNPYKRPFYYWKILAARLAFIIVFQNIVAWLQQIIDWAIPDKPTKLNSQIKRENYLVSNKIIREEKFRILQSARAKAEDIDYVNGAVYFEAKS
ncbi:CLUMA_CG011990, isoform A [Clunio marinus]|uniref:Anoctamin n=1 Tax=Clunio marinus TaxID=568069 RepID=A0A1J1IF49_9DIPT|nr:CLUMA_CG011990, isoform A [Clunio marinus]